MNNFEKIKNMTLDEMAEMLKLNAAKLLTIKKFSDFTNQDGIAQWLQQESEDNQ